MVTRMPILMYHNLDEEASPISLRPERFAWQMRCLHERGYRVVQLGEIVRRLRAGQPLSRKEVAITFDDGFESVYQLALPILSRYGFTATVFLVPPYCGKTNTWPDQPPGMPSYPLMSWAQIRELDRSEIEIGAHGLNHRRLDRLPHEEAKDEVLGSKARIEDRLGHTIRYFAYPYGRYNAGVQAIVRQAFRGAVAAHPGLAGNGNDPWALPRIDAYYVARSSLFRQMDNRFFGLYLGFRRSLRSIASWLLRRQW